MTIPTLTLTIVTVLALWCYWLILADKRGLQLIHNWEFYKSRMALKGIKVTLTSVVPTEVTVLFEGPEIRIRRKAVRAWALIRDINSGKVNTKQLREMSEWPPAPLD